MTIQESNKNRKSWIFRPLVDIFRNSPEKSSPELVENFQALHSPENKELKHYGNNTNGNRPRRRVKNRDVTTRHYFRFSGELCWRHGCFRRLTVSDHRMEVPYVVPCFNRSRYIILINKFYLIEFPIHPSSCCRKLRKSKNRRWRNGELLTWKLEKSKMSEWIFFLRLVSTISNHRIFDKTMGRFSPSKIRTYAKYWKVIRLYVIRKFYGFRWRLKCS